MGHRPELPLSCTKRVCPCGQHLEGGSAVVGLVADDLAAAVARNYVAQAWQSRQAINRSPEKDPRLAGPEGGKRVVIEKDRWRVGGKRPGSQNVRAGVQQLDLALEVEGQRGGIFVSAVDNDDVGGV